MRSRALAVRSCVVAAFATLVASACSNLNTMRSVQTTGCVANGHYYAPGGEFSMPIPRWSTTVQDIVTEDPTTRRSAVQIAFFEDHGRWNGIECIPISDPTAVEHAAPDETRAKLSAWFEGTLIPNQKAVFPRLSVVASEELALRDGSPALFALVDMPEGSHIVDEKKERAGGFWGMTGGISKWERKRRDTMRAFLCSFHRGSMYLSSAAHDELERQAPEGETPEGRVRRLSEPAYVQSLKDELLALQASLEMPSKPAPVADATNAR